MSSSAEPIAHRVTKLTRSYPEHLLPNGLARDATVAVEALDRVRERFTLCLFRYEAFRAMDSAFFRRIDKSPTIAPFIMVKSALRATIIVSLVALYDPDEKSVNLPKIAKALLHPRTLPVLQSHHRVVTAAYGAAPIKSDDVANKIRRLQRRLKNGRLAERLDRMTSLRNKELAHTDVNPSLVHALPSDHDIHAVFAYTANLFVTLESFVIGLSASCRLIRHKPRSQAQRLIQSVVPLGAPQV